MADPKRRLPGNAPGPFFVDATCIDCDTCRQIAPSIFEEADGASIVTRQPRDEHEQKRARMALVACPTGSIGGTGAAEGVAAYPEPIAPDLYFCGFTSADSYGAWSWLVRRPEGNVLVDSPRFAAPLVKRIEALGGVKTMFLTHRDDVADHEAWARRFGAERVMMAADGAARLGVERVLDGVDPVRLADDLLVIPTPGHTRGHAALLAGKALFTGDHLAWDPDRGRLTAFRSVCWYSWAEQTRSMERLLDHDFEWVLPGHGPVHHDTVPAMREHLRACVAWMRSVR